MKKWKLQKNALEHLSQINVARMLMMAYLLLILAPMFVAQTIRVDRIKDDFGYIIIDQGEVAIPAEFRNHVIEINTTELEISFDVL